MHRENETIGMVLILVGLACIYKHSYITGGVFIIIGIFFLKFSKEEDKVEERRDRPKKYKPRGARKK